MSDSTIKKVQSAQSPIGRMGQAYLVSGKRVSMRLWVAEKPAAPEQAHENTYETVGLVLSGRANLDIEGQTITLTRGDSWLVPAGARHRYEILERFSAVEATAPPAQVHGRDESQKT
jgi:quercetin dioxygenase-like cupin family protein